MTAPTGAKVWTWQEALQLPDGERYEVINGELRERNMSSLSSAISMVLGGLLREWMKGSGKRGWLTGEAGGFTIFPWAEGDVRMPDVAFTSRERAGAMPERGWFAVSPELAVEIVSPNDRFSDAEDKARDYIRAGVDLVWVVVPNTESIQVWRKDGSRSVLQSGETLSGEDVLVGFSVAVADLFAELD